PDYRVIGFDPVDEVAGRMNLLHQSAEGLDPANESTDVAVADRRAEHAGIDGAGIDRGSRGAVCTALADNRPDDREPVEIERDVTGQDLNAVGIGRRYQIAGQLITAGLRDLEGKSAGGIDAGLIDEDHTIHG